MSPELLDPFVAKLQVDIWSDVVCPWCYIGKRRFEAALAGFEHRESVEVVWRSFELDPNARNSHHVEGTYAERIARKYRLSPSEAAARLHHMTEMAAAEGLEFRFDLAKPGNTFDAHRLLHLARERGGRVQDELKERFDRATFGEGLSVSDHDELTALAVEVGLDEESVRSTLASDRYADAVRADEAAAAEYDITGVPFFVLGGKFGVSGAQGPEYLLRALQHAWRETAVPVGGAGPVCDDDSCAV